MEDFDIGEASWREYGNFLYYFHNSSVSLTLFQNKKFKNTYP